LITTGGITGNGEVRPAIRIPRSILATTTISFNRNGQTGGTVPVDITRNIGGTWGPNITVNANFVRPGYTLQGFYNHATAGTRAFNANGQVETNPPAITATTTTLWARWTANSGTVTFNGNGHTGGNLPANHTRSTGQAWLGTVTTSVVRAGHTLQGFYTAQTGGTRIYSADGQRLLNAPTVLKATPNATTTLWARWTANSGTVSFNINGGSGTVPASFTRTTGQAWPASITVATDIDLLGHIFIGFGIGQTDGQLVFNSIGQRVASPPALVMPAGGLTLYAQWVPIGGAGTMGLAETVSEAHQLRLTRTDFPNETTWQRFNVALRQAEWALWNLHNLTSGQVAAIAGELRTSMDARS